MKKIALLLSAALVIFSSFTIMNTIEDADVYPSNLSENTYFTKYDDNTKIISGINFLSLSDGTNSKYVTPAFKVKLYLWYTGAAQPIYVATYETEGQYHMGSREFKDKVVDLSKVEGLASGTYRLGIFVDADNEVKEPNEDNNVVLFEGEIKYTAGTGSTGVTNNNQNPFTKDDDASTDDNEEGEGDGNSGW
jgi:hypothetical protein